MSQPPLFPFSALLGQENLQRALLLSAIDPSIGGVLIEGPRGTAKSTSARALSELLPDSHFVTLPLGASEEQLLGSLDLENVLQKSEVKFAPGLLAKAHGGVLYVDEVNLLPDALVDQLLDVAASQVNVIERDGISHAHAASFVLIGTMNREEGELRPQLLDRFGLALALENYNDAKQRQCIVKARIEFDNNPTVFRERFVAQQQTLTATIQRARTNLPQLIFSDAVYAHASELCIAAQVDGLRADLVMLRAARALAALQGDTEITVAHVDAIAELALHHRRHAPPQTSSRKQQNDSAASTQNTANEKQQSEQPETWGEMPPQSVEAIVVKGVKPLPVKKR
ncbi:MAG: ChlI component of cobalt chelatase involved in biosynthesis [Verrucomicrobiaceae bacterium]|nr:ChlI component of cobalt chelatase involved in biosynthesis [Verrucomicrobiaceae bacterium]